MKVFLEDLQEAEANVVRLRNQFIRERGWKEVTLPWKNGLLFTKTFMRSELNNQFGLPDGETTTAQYMTVDEAIDLEKSFGSKNLHNTAAAVDA